MNVKLRNPKSLNDASGHRAGNAPVYWLAVLGLAGVAMMGVCWIASSVLAQNGTEKLLRVGHLFPKLNSNHGERKADAFRTSEPVPSAMAHPKERATLPPAPLPLAHENPKVKIVDAPLALAPLPTPEPPRGNEDPWLLMTSKVDAPTPVEPCSESVVFLEPCGPKRGDTPMIRNWKMLTMLSLLSATVSLTPPAHAGEKESKGDLKKSIDKLIERIDELETKPVDKKAIGEALRAELKKLEDGLLGEIKTDIGIVQIKQREQKKELEDQRMLINLLTTRIEGLERKMITGVPTGPSVDKAFMDELKVMIRTLTDTVAKSAPSQSHISMSPPTNGSATGAARVLLANHYPDELLFIVNGVGHRLPARSTKLVDVNSGALNYEVFSTRFGVLERRTTNLASGHTFNLAAQ
jgi:hypothetical protein